MHQVSDVVSLKDRGKYQGLISAATSIGNSIGPFAGGGLATAGQWRWVFWWVRYEVVPRFIGVLTFESRSQDDLPALRSHCHQHTLYPALETSRRECQVSSSRPQGLRTDADRFTRPAKNQTASDRLRWNRSWSRSHSIATGE